MKFSKKEFLASVLLIVFSFIAGAIFCDLNQPEITVECFTGVT